jgi:hypothetical protein
MDGKSNGLFLPSPRSSCVLLGDSKTAVDLPEWPVRKSSLMADLRSLANVYP